MASSALTVPGRDRDIAIVGMAARLPGARNIDEFWANLRAGRESVTFFSDAELRAAGVDDALMARPDYVKANAILPRADTFDAAFFGYTPREAELLDVQQRVFLECAWNAIEHAGYDPLASRGAFGVFAGAGLNTYLLRQIVPNPAAVASAGGFQVMIANDKDFLATRVSYKLNLRGPGLTVQTACSTSLVAVHLACQSLLCGECDTALAGGVSIRVPQVTGYVHQVGMILSPDGHCRAFDAQAAGTIGGNGAGAVVLKRVEDALAAGDTIHAIIRGSAINNDGAGKVGYTAPGLEGQEAVIAEALAVAEVAPDEISYVEAHGTGTPLGDPIEVLALTRAFRRGTARKQFCAIGSVKTNLGHLDAAAGIAGLIKTVLALQHREIPPSLHFTAPNPQIDFPASPFRVADQLVPWAAGKDGAPRRAGVSSFGIGGTNAHVVLEEAPIAPAFRAGRVWQVFALSARTKSARATLTEDLAAELSTGKRPLADAAYTLALGRREFSQRAAVVARDAAEAAVRLRAGGLQDHAGDKARPVAFLFPGQGTQFPGMGAGLYRSDPVFCAEIDRCAERLRAPLGCDLREVMFDQKGDVARLTRTSLAQPAIFTLSYALAKLLESWGVVPRAMLGHSIGEWVAACLAEVFTLEEALRLVSARGRLMEAQPPGAMLAIMRPEAEVRGLLGAGLEIAAVNASEQTVVAGAESAVAALEATLAVRGVASARVQTSHAFHSATMEPAARALVEEFRGVPRRTPKQPWISNVTGKWITAEAAGDPEYWARQLRGTVRFADGLATLLATPDLALVEVGAGRTLTGLAVRHPAWMTTHRAVVSSRGVRDAADDGETIATALGRLWCAGAKIDWHAYYEGQERRRVPLPTYPFEGERYWIDAAPKVSAPVDSSPAKKPDLADWFYLPSWTRTLAPASLPAVTDGEWLVIGDEAGLAEKLVARLRAQGAVVRVAIAGAPAVAELKKGGRAPRWVLMLSDVTALNADPADGAGFNVLIDLAKALGEVALPTGARLTIAANGLQAFAGEQRLQPGKALLHGPARVVPKEVPGLEARVVDVVWPGADADMVIDALLDEARGGDGEFVALRGRDRWRQTAEPVRIEPATARWRERGVYLITGGLGGIGLALAEDLARRWRARLVLVGRTAPGASVQKRIDALVAAGGEVVTAAVEVSDESAVRKLRDEVRARFGAVHGIIHAAGVAGGGVLARRTAAETAAVLTPKVAGTRALDRVFAADGLDFFVLMSSLTAQFGEFGQADYAAANAFIDAYAQARQHEGAPMIAIGWDAWRDSGMAARVSAGPALVGWQEAQRARQLTDAEGAEVLQRAVGCGAAHILISTHDLAARRTADAAALSGKESGQVRAVVARHPRPALPAPLVLPRNDGERALAAIWEELLGIESVGVNDSFFDLGGHSLLATQVLARVREAGGAGLTLAVFFEAPTIATFAERIAAQARGPSEPALVPAPRDQPLPLSFSQQALWLLDRMDGASVHYNEFGAQRIRGRLQPALLAAALTELVRRHEALRTRFVERDGGPVQEILPPFAVELPVIALGGRTLEEHAAELTVPAFDLSHGPLLRARLVAVAPDEHVLMAVVHHIVFDGWSSGIFFREMIAVYGALVEGKPTALPALALQYLDFAVWQRAWLAGERQGKLADFWRGQLAGKLPVLALPTDRPRPTRQSFHGKKLPIDLGADLTGRLEALGRGQEASLFMTLLAGYAILLGRMAAQEDVVIGCPTAGRERRELEPLIGFFINPLAILVSLAGDPRFAELLARVRKTVLSAYAHSALPFEQVVEAVHPKRDPARSPIFQVLFVFQNSTPVSAPPAGLTLESWEAPDVPARSDIDLCLWETPGGVRGHFVYNADLFSEATVRRLAGRWRMLLEAAATTPEARVTELRMEQPPQLPRLASLASRGPTS